MRVHKIMIVLSSLMVLTACGKSDDKGVSVKPLSSSQKSKVSSVVSSMDTATEAAQTAGGNDREQISPLSKLSKPPTEFEKREKIRIMSEVLERSDCQFENTVPQAPDGSIPDGKYHFSVDGLNCPISMKFEVGYLTKQTSNSFDMQMTMDQYYKASDSTYKHLNDVYGIDIKGLLSVHASRTGMNGKGNFKGMILSQTHGKIAVSLSVSMSGNQEGSSSTMQVGLVFKDFTAKGKIVSTAVDNREKVQYFVNDEKVTEKEFQDVFGNLISSGSQSDEIMRASFLH